MPCKRSIRVNDRDIRLMVTVGEYGVLDRTLCHILCFANSSAEWCRQVLARLTSAGLIQATTLQVWYDDGTSRGGRIPTLYSLTRAGAEVVHLRIGKYPPRVLRSEPSPASFWHRLQVVQIRVAFEKAAALQDLPPMSWIHESDLVLNQA